MGLWGPHGAAKAVWVGFWGSSIRVRVTKCSGTRAAKWLFWNPEMKSMMICRLGAVGGVATVGLGMAGKVRPGGGLKPSRLIVSCVVWLRSIEFRY